LDGVTNALSSLADTVWATLRPEEEVDYYHY
jgi:hypothetical protein